MHNDGIQWISSHGMFELGYWIMFTEGLEPQEFAYRMGFKDEDLEFMDWNTGTHREAEEDSIAQVVHIGKAGNWTYSVSRYGSVIIDSSVSIASLSAGTVAISLERTVNADTWYGIAENGQLTSYFSAPFIQHRGGSSPDLLKDDLITEGILLADGTAPLIHRLTLRESEERLLRIIEARFGLSLPIDRIKSKVHLTGILLDE